MQVIDRLGGPLHPVLHQLTDGRSRKVDVVTELPFVHTQSERRIQVSYIVPRARPYAVLAALGPVYARGRIAPGRIAAAHIGIGAEVAYGGHPGGTCPGKGRGVGRVNYLYFHLLYLGSLRQVLRGTSDGDQLVAESRVRRTYVGRGVLVIADETVGGSADRPGVLVVAHQRAVLGAVHGGDHQQVLVAAGQRRGRIGPGRSPDIRIGHLGQGGRGVAPVAVVIPEFVNLVKEIDLHRAANCRTNTGVLVVIGTVEDGQGAGHAAIYGVGNTRGGPHRVPVESEGGAGYFLIGVGCVQAVHHAVLRPGGDVIGGAGGHLSRGRDLAVDKILVPIHQVGAVAVVGVQPEVVHVLRRGAGLPQGTVPVKTRAPQHPLHQGDLAVRGVVQRRTADGLQPAHEHPFRGEGHGGIRDLGRGRLVLVVVERGGGPAKGVVTHAVLGAGIDLVAVVVRPGHGVGPAYLRALRIGRGARRYPDRAAAPVGPGRAGPHLTAGNVADGELHAAGAEEIVVDRGTLHGGHALAGGVIHRLGNVHLGPVVIAGQPDRDVAVSVGVRPGEAAQVPDVGGINIIVGGAVDGKIVGSGHGGVAVVLGVHQGKAVMIAVGAAGGEEIHVIALARGKAAPGEGLAGGRLPAPGGTDIPGRRVNSGVHHHGIGRSGLDHAQVQAVRGGSHFLQEDLGADHITGIGVGGEVVAHAPGPVDITLVQNILQGIRGGGYYPAFADQQAFIAASGERGVWLALVISAGIIAQHKGRHGVGDQGVRLDVAAGVIDLQVIVHHARRINEVPAAIHGARVGVAENRAGPVGEVAGHGRGAHEDVVVQPGFHRGSAGSLHLPVSPPGVSAALVHVGVSQVGLGAGSGAKRRGYAHGHGLVGDRRAAYGHGDLVYDAVVLRGEPEGYGGAGGGGTPVAAVQFVHGVVHAPLVVRGAQFGDGEQDAGQGQQRQRRGPEQPGRARDDYVLSFRRHFYKRQGTARPRMLRSFVGSFSAIPL